MLLRWSSWYFNINWSNIFQKIFSDSKFNLIKHDKNKVINKFLNDYINLFDKDPLENKIIKINKSNFKKNF